MRGPMTGAIGLALAFACERIEKHTKKEPNPMRSIDDVLAANQSPSMRTINGGIGDVLTVMGATAREFAQLGLTEEAEKLKEERRALDAKWAMLMQAKAARET